jgi:guanylate kinase
MNGKVILLSAPSGAGKSTLIKFLLEVFPELSFSVSATTRPPRGQERNGEHYYFMTSDEFERAIAQNKFVEYEQVYEGVYYGTLFSEVHRIWQQGKTVIMDVDVRGALNIKKTFGHSALSVFISVSDTSILKARLQQRGEDGKRSLEERVLKATHEISFSDKFDAIVLNDELESAKNQIKQLVESFLRAS